MEEDVVLGGEHVGDAITLVRHGPEASTRRTLQGEGSEFYSCDPAGVTSTTY